MSQCAVRNCPVCKNSSDYQMSFERNSFKSSFIHIPPDLMYLLIAMATIVYGLFPKLCILCLRAAMLAKPGM